jgi:D-alanyl-D-alanine dipeptidase
MVYATPYNFMGRVLYEGLDEAYLVPEAMAKLRKANELLRKKRMDLHLVVYDAARPRSIQIQMWKVVENTDLQDFVANPYKSGGGAHNYGVAVDVTLVDCTGHPIPMGSEYDYFGDRSRVDLEDELIKKGEINQRELQNRQLLREIMTEAGWLVEPSEWWHFNAMPITEASERLTVIQ